jgi:hypothetical protein
MSEFTGNVPLPVGCWTMIGWAIQLAIFFTHSRVRLEPSPRPA